VLVRVAQCNAVPDTALLCTGEKGSVWFFNFFFYNRHTKQILYFSCRAVSKSAAEVRSFSVLRGAG
jgi:hypothetical protein